MRDNFPANIRTALARRVCYRCSNDTCRKPTSGPHSDPLKATVLGEAAHITAAAQGGPRYDATLTNAQRSSIGNGIWLCATCASLIDKDENKYPVELLQRWKIKAELEAEIELVQPSLSKTASARAVHFYAVCFDRPAFTDRHERSYDDLEIAVRDTITAINTGVLRTRDGLLLVAGPAKSALLDRAMIHEVTELLKLLGALRDRLHAERASGNGRLSLDSSGMSFVEDLRRRILSAVNAFCHTYGVLPLAS